MQATSLLLVASLTLGFASKPTPPEPKLVPTSEVAHGSTATPVPMTSPPAPVRDPLACRRESTCLRLTIAGMSVATLGLAGIVTGSVLLTRPDQLDPLQPIFVSSLRPAGRVTLMISAGVTLTAALMLIAARRSLAKPDQSARVRLTPMGLRF